MACGVQRRSVGTASLPRRCVSVTRSSRYGIHAHCALWAQPHCPIACLCARMVSDAGPMVPALPACDHRPAAKRSRAAGTSASSCCRPSSWCACVWAWQLAPTSCCTGTPSLSRRTSSRCTLSSGAAAHGRQGLGTHRLCRDTDNEQPGGCGVCRHSDAGVALPPFAEVQLLQPSQSWRPSNLTRSPSRPLETYARRRIPRWSIRAPHVGLTQFTHTADVLCADFSRQVNNTTCLCPCVCQKRTPTQLPVRVPRRVAVCPPRRLTSARAWWYRDVHA